ncbi:ATP-binding protein [Microbacterium sp. LWH13-1.2]|uniref:AAA family ATPase n=1 Tax=Microbacterium sp. LWH13-1.2 TaxID=3135260 RepID=UPI003139852A
MSDAVLILMCGMSFSGKSTLAKFLASRLNASIVSLDEINAERGLRGGLGMTGDQWAATHRIAQERVARHLAARQIAIVDDTGSPRFIRDAWREVADRANAPMRIIWVDVDEVLQSERLAANRASGQRHDVVDEVMAEHRRTFEPPEDEGAVRIDAADLLSCNAIEEVVNEIRLMSAPEG